MATQNLDNALTRLRIEKTRKRQRRGGLKWFFILALLAVAGGGYVYYARANTPLPVKIVKTRTASGPQPGATLLTTTGYVIPRNRIEISSKIIGRVEEIFVDRGSKVKPGDVLLKIEDADLQAQVRQAQANLAMAKARLNELLSGSRPQEIEAAQAAVNSAEATMKNTELDYKRMEQLGADNTVISRQALDKARMEYNVATAALESARKNYELVKKGPRQEVIDAARAQVGQAAANLEYTQTQLSYTVIHAPIGGTILQKLAKKGELVSFQNFGGSGGPKTSVFSMADLTDLQVEIDVNENEMPKVSMHQPCQVSLDSAPDQVMKGVVDEIAPEADRQKATVQVKVAIKNPTDAMRPEINARVTFQETAGARPAAAAAAQTRVYVPRGAVVSDAQGGKSVYVVSGGQAVARAIKVGDDGPEGVRVLEGLKGGEDVVADPPEGLKDGAKITSEAKS